MKRGVGRGRLGCPRPAVSAAARRGRLQHVRHDAEPRERGHTLLELLLILGFAAVLTGTAAAGAHQSIARARGLVAARYLAARMTMARTQAAAWGAAVALRFEPTPDGPSFSVYRDGNRNGVQTAEIARNVDVQVEPPVLLSERFPGVRIGVAPAVAVSDPVHIGETTILTFSPAGTATSGTIYIAGPDGTQWGVRVLGATGRTRVLRHDPGRDEWFVAY